MMRSLTAYNLYGGKAGYNNTDELVILSIRKCL